MPKEKKGFVDKRKWKVKNNTTVKTATVSKNKKTKLRQSFKETGSQSNNTDKEASKSSTLSRTKKGKTKLTQLYNFTDKDGSKTTSYTKGKKEKITRGKKAERVYKRKSKQIERQSNRFDKKTNRLVARRNKRMLKKKE
tara:strand:- start:133 stop:549 length:417 start_codon:yes stop_codon:yes gene_type:complete